MSCNNRDLTDAVDIFPRDLDEPAVAIELSADKETGALHIHQGRDCVVLPHHLADDFADHISRVAGIEYARAED